MPRWLEHLKEGRGLEDGFNYNDPEADVLTIKIKEGALADEELLDNNIILGYDSDKNLVSIEVLDALKKGLLNALMELTKSKRNIARFLLSK
jgi:uncharacterized protein YuzE